MPANATSAPESATRTDQQQLLHAFEREHATTMKVLRAFPPEQAEFRPGPTCRTARELAFVFALERELAGRIYRNELAAKGPSGGMPSAPSSWDAVIAAIEKGQRQLLDLIRSADDAALSEKVKFFTGPKTIGDYVRRDFLWFLLHDEIHHRGQFSIYLRLVGGKVPAIYGPSGDEPWT